MDPWSIHPVATRRISARITVSTSRGGGDRSASDQDRRKRILQVAERLFSHYGPSKTTMADIAKDVGIGVGTLYLDFGSKEEILDELQADGGKLLAGAMERAARQASTPEARIVVMLETRVRVLLDLKERGAHACDLIRCGAASFWKSGAKEAPGASSPPVLDADVRTLLHREIVLLSTAHRLTLSPDEATAAIEAAFSPLSPPLLFRYEPRHALALAGNLARLLVHGLVSGATEGATAPVPGATPDPA